MRGVQRCVWGHHRHRQTVENRAGQCVPPGGPRLNKKEAERMTVRMDGFHEEATQGPGAQCGPLTGSAENKSGCSVGRTAQGLFQSFLNVNHFVSLSCAARGVEQ